MEKENKIPQADRFVGKTELSAEEIKRFFEEAPLDEAGKAINDPEEILAIIFKEIAPTAIKNLELPKTERDLDIIRLATEAVKRFAQEFGRTDFNDLPIGHIHFLKEGGVKEYTNGRFGTGSHSSVVGEVFVERLGDLETTITTFHELWHALASYQTLQATTDNRLSWYRSGFGIKSRDGKEQYFYRIDEGLTGLITKRFVEEVLVRSPDFQEEIERRIEEGIEIDTTRVGEVESLLHLADEVYKNNKQSFESRDEIVKLFFRGQVTGNILPAARLLEKTFYKGVFRRLGEMDWK